ncbi:MAG: lysozyme inhibitor LprI family protein [Azonexus sp.]
MKKSLLFTLGLLACSASFAQDADPCLTQRNTGEMDECGKQTLARKDKELNAAYQALLKQLVADDPRDAADFAETRKLLLDAQRTWIKFRDADCKGKLVLYAGGSMRGSVYFRCMTEHTEQRTKELLKWLN